MKKWCTFAWISYFKYTKTRLLYMVFIHQDKIIILHSNVIDNK